MRSGETTLVLLSHLSPEEPFHRPQNRLKPETWSLRNHEEWFDEVETILDQLELANKTPINVGLNQA